MGEGAPQDPGRTCSRELASGLQGQSGYRPRARSTAAGADAGQRVVYSWVSRSAAKARLAAIVYLVQAGCSWPKLPAQLFGISRATAHRRFTEWTNAGLWERLHQAFLHHLGVIGEIDWSRAVVDSIAVRAEKVTGIRNWT